MYTVTLMNQCIGKIFEIPQSQRELVLMPKETALLDNEMTSEILLDRIYSNNVHNILIQNLQLYVEFYYSRCISALTAEDAQVPSGMLFIRHWMDFPECEDITCKLPGTKYDVQSGDCIFMESDGVEYNAIEAVTQFCSPVIADPQPTRRCTTSLGPNMPLFAGEYICSSSGAKFGIDPSRNGVSFLTEDDTVCSIYSNAYDDDIFLMLNNEGQLGLYDVASNVNALGSGVNRRFEYFERRQEYVPIHTFPYIGNDTLSNMCDETTSDCKVEVDGSLVYLTNNNQTIHFIEVDEIVTTSGNRYFFNSRRMRQEEHQQCAEAYGGSLAWFESADEHTDFMANVILPETGSYAYLGYRRDFDLDKIIQLYNNTEFDNLDDVFTTTGNEHHLALEYTNSSSPAQVFVAPSRRLGLYRMYQ
uniref:Uncharacterized protein n=1 Tax=Corethron hystrix TaxID=216773 RepID=A0A6U5FLN7_9STRA